MKQESLEMFLKCCLTTTITTVNWQWVPSRWRWNGESYVSKSETCGNVMKFEWKYVWIQVLLCTVKFRQVQNTSNPSLVGFSWAFAGNVVHKRFDLKLVLAKHKYPYTVCQFTTNTQLFCCSCMGSAWELESAQSISWRGGVKGNLNRTRLWFHLGLVFCMFVIVINCCLCFYSLLWL